MCTACTRFHCCPPVQAPPCTLQLCWAINNHNRSTSWGMMKCNGSCLLADSLLPPVIMSDICVQCRSLLCRCCRLSWQKHLQQFTRQQVSPGQGSNNNNLLLGFGLAMQLDSLGCPSSCTTVISMRHACMSCMHVCPAVVVVCRHWHGICGLGVI